MAKKAIFVQALPDLLYGRAGFKVCLKKHMSRLVIVKTGTTFPNTIQKYGDFEDWTCQGMGVDLSQVSLIDAQHNDSLPSVKECSGVVVTGSHLMVTDELAWIAPLVRWIRKLVNSDIPFLGICFGHQLLAESCGGSVGRHPLGKEIGTVDIDLLSESSTDRLFQDLPSQFCAHATHEETILSLPMNAACLAANSFGNQAIRIGGCAWGVQFHPEYDTRIIKSYIEEQKQSLEAGGRNISQICRTVRDTPEAAGILKKFYNIVKQNQ